MYDDGEKMAVQPPQEQETQPGIESEMAPAPISVFPHYRPSDKLKNKVAIVTGGDSGIGRAIAYHYALEGADVAIMYLEESEDAKTTRQFVERQGRRCLLIPGDAGSKPFCENAAKRVLQEFGKIDILVNNAAEQHPTTDLDDITEEQLERTFRTNIFSYFFMAQAVHGDLKPGSSIINTASVTAYRGSKHLLDYAATKGAIVSFTRSLAQMLIEKKIRVNAVAPGPIWTPLIPASFTAKQVSEFGSDTPMKRPGQPAEVATCYVFLASEDSSYITGQVLHPNGGEIVNT